MKKPIRILVAIIVIIIVIIFTALIYIDSLARQGIEAGAAYATGVAVTLDSADVGIASGELTMDQLNIANPEGFEADYFFKLGQGYVEVGLSSLMSDKVEIPVIALRDIELVVERVKGKNNFDAILEHLKQLSSANTDDTPSEPGKSYNISQITLEKISVQVKGFGISTKPIVLPTIKLTNIGSGGEGVQMAKVVGIVIRELLNSLLSDPSRLPDALVAGLGEGLEGLGDLGQVGVEALNEVTEKAAEAVEQISEDVDQTVDKIEDATKDLKNTVEGLGKLFGDKKDKEEK